MNKLFKSAMFFTSFLPLWITVLFIDIKSLISNKVYIYTEYIVVCCILIGILCSIIIIWFSMKNIKISDYRKYKVVEATQEKGITSEFLLSYILPLFVFDFTKWDSVIQFIIYFGILAFLCIRNNNVYANLLFELKNYKFYTCELVWVPEPGTKSIQVLAISCKNLCANKGNTIEIAPLNKPFYLVK
ncbi:hypothetical protein [Clostridium cadaveris]|uniref:hypothetical protein n=1 Tax=Clostridium cadaveris TaxID=1529 RepID=UPI00399F6EE7